MKTITRWVVACRAGTDKPWHINFSGALHINFVSAAQQAFAFNEGSHGYQHKPVRVSVRPDEELELCD